MLRPVAAGIRENEHSVVETTETRIKPKAGAPFEFKRAQFISDKTGWAMTAKSLYRTSDGGKIWERLETSPQEDATFTSFHFVNETRGWLTELKQIDAVRYGLGNSSRIMVTDDGGRSWKAQADFPNEVKFRDIRFLNADEGLATGARVIDHGQVYDEIFVVRTSNGGREWTDISEAVKVAIKNEYGMASDFGQHIYWKSESSVLLLTTYGRVIGTTDRCATWKTVARFEDVRPSGFASSTGYYKLLLDPNQRIRVIAGGMGDEGYWGDLVVNDDNGSWASYELNLMPILDVYISRLMT